MRRLCLILLVAVFALPASATGARQAPGDGSLTVRNASGKVVVQGKGVIYGYLEKGSLTIVAYAPDGLSVPSVSGAKLELAGRKATVVYTGSRVRFLFPGGSYTLRFEGSGLDLSAVGSGQVQAVGLGPAQSIGVGSTPVAPRGMFAVNGAKPIVVGVGTLVASYGLKSSPTTATTRAGRS